MRDTLGYAVLFSIYASEDLRERLPMWLVGGLSGLSASKWMNYLAERLRVVVVAEASAAFGDD